MITPPLPTGPFDLILADPGWAFETWSSKGRKKCPKYRTESVERICALPVRQIAARRCRLLLWVANTHLDRGCEVIRAWGLQVHRQLAVDQGRRANYGLVGAL